MQEAELARQLQALKYDEAEMARRHQKIADLQTKKKQLKEEVAAAAESTAPVTVATVAATIEKMDLDEVKTT